MAEKHVISQHHQMFIDERTALFEQFGEDSYKLKKKFDDDLLRWLRNIKSGFRVLMIKKAQTKNELVRANFTLN